MVSHPIEWLRAFAVICVVIYHFDKNLMPGGFLGVDIFLVISGYLVGGHILQKADTQQLDLRAFFIKRFWRLQPALIATILFCLAFGFITSTPEELAGFAKVAVSSFFGFSNIYYWTQSGYFGGEAEYNYLLHTWSLSLEWQYYAVAAIVGYFFSRLFKQSGYYFVVLIGVVSFFLCVIMAKITHSFGFFNLPTRMWEFIAGTIVWRLNTQRVFPRFSVSPLPLIAGILGCLGCVFYLDESDPMPSLITLLPVISASVFMLGANYEPRRLVRAVMSPFFRIGGASYSLYLVHWPILVFFHVDAFSNFSRIISAFLSMTLLAFLMKQYVEEPFVKPQISRYFRRSALLACSLVIASSVLLFHWTDGFPARLTEQQLKLISYSQSYNDDRADCLNIASRSEGNVRNKRCQSVAGIDASDLHVLLWGDSHLETLRYPFLTDGVLNGYSLDFVGVAGCPPVIGLNRLSGAKGCAEYASAVMEELLHAKTKQLVVIGARYSSYIYGNTSALGKAEGGQHQFLSLNGETTNSDESRFRALENQLRIQVAQLVNVGHQVLLIGGVPEYGQRVPREYFSRSVRGDVDFSMQLERDLVELRTASVDDLFIELSNIEGVHYFDPKTVLCDAEFCSPEKNGALLYFDDDHLNKFGAELVYSKLRVVISNILHKVES